MKILFFLGQLGTGGAERQYSQLAAALAAKGHHVAFLTVYPGGQQWEALEASPCNVQLNSLFPEKGRYPFRSLIHFFGSMWKLRHYAADFEVLYSGLHLPNLIACLATLGRSRPALVWGIRASDMTLNTRRALPRRLCAIVSSWVDMLISNSHSGLRYHQELGYRTQRCEVIPNGIDTSLYTFSDSDRRATRAELGIEDQHQLIGVVGRIDPMKGHEIFLQAFAEIAKSHPRVRAVVVGGGPQSRAAALYEQCEQLNIADRVIWTGPRKNLTALYSAMDLFCLSSSYGEGFPNVLGEAMSCELPAVVTDVGDAARILDDSSFVVPTRDAKALANALGRAIDSGLHRSPENRRRIEQRFAVAAVVDASEEILQSIACPSS